MAENRELNLILRLKDEVSRELQGISGQLDKMQPAFKTMAAVGTAAFAGVTAAIGLSVKAAVEFESTFAGVRKTVDATEEEFAELEKTIRKMAKTIPISTSELNKIGELAGQLGVGIKDIEKFTEIIAELGVTTNLSSEEAATSLARLANIMQEPLENVDRMGAAIVDLGNNFATTEAEIVEYGLRIAGAGKVVGLTTDQVLAIGTAMSSVGVQAEAGGTAVQKVLLEMHKSAIIGGDAVKAFADIAGMSSDEFSNRWKDKPIEAFASFVKGIQEKGDEAVKVFGDIGMEDVRLVRAFLSLANAGDLLKNSINTGTEAWSENIALQEEAKKRFATTESQMQLLKNQINDVAITLGDVFLPIINDLIKSISPFVERLTDWISKNPELAKNILLVTGAVGGLIAAIGIFGMMLPNLIAAGTGFGIMFTALTGPIGAVIAIVGMLIAAGVLLYKNWDTVKENLIKTWEAIKGAFRDAINALIGLAESWVNIYIKAINLIISALNKIKFSIPDWVPGIGGNSFGININRVAEIVLPKLAEGGVVTRPTTALIGEAGPEAIVPLNRMAGAGIGGLTINVYGDITGQDLIDRVGEELMKMIKKEQRL